MSPHGHHRRHVEAWVQRYGIKPFLAWRLHRRVFAWFGLSIIVTAVVAGGAMHLVNRGPGSWHRDYQGAQGFLGHQFSHVWDDPTARQALAHDLATDLDVRVELRDAAGAAVGGAGGSCGRGFIEAPVVRDGARLGTVRLCAERYGPQPWKFLLIAAVVLFSLWVMTGRIARRLVRPLGMVIEVADELGKGNLKSRAPIDECNVMGEERILGDALNRMADRIERQMADQRELLAQVSHELRTPLGHIRLLLEMAREKPEPRTLDELEKEVTEIDSLVGELLASSRVTFDALNLRPLDATELAARALERAGVSGGERLRVLGAPRVHADATLVMRALANLLENAKGHAGSVEALEVAAEGEWVRFTVVDRGPGFAPGDESRAFNPFFHRPRAGDGEGGSLGLGLALVQRIAQAHGGDASAQNREGGGAQVSFTVRAAQPDVQPAAEPARI